VQLQEPRARLEYLEVVCDMQSYFRQWPSARSRASVLFGTDLFRVQRTCDGRVASEDVSNRSASHAGGLLLAVSGS
jgi:hypothetical protein